MLLDSCLVLGLWVKFMCCRNMTMKAWKERKSRTPIINQSKYTIKAKVEIERDIKARIDEDLNTYKQGTVF